MERILSRYPAKPLSNSSITLHLLPSQEILSRESTLVYEKTTCVLFDMTKDPENRVRRNFRLTSAKSRKINPEEEREAVNRMRSNFLVLELFDHSSAKTHKVFRGMILLSFQDIAGNESVYFSIVRIRIHKC